MLDNLYENIGGTIKSWAKWIFVVETIGAVITGIFLLVEYHVLAGLLTLLFGPMVAFVSTWLLYAFGELVEDVHAMRNKYYPQTEEKAKREIEKRTQRDTEEKAKREAEKTNPPAFIMQKKSHDWDHWNEEDSSIGQCEICAKKHQPLLFVEFEDSNGKHQKDRCFDCFSRRDCSPVEHRK